MLLKSRLNHQELHQDRRFVLGSKPPLDEDSGPCLLVVAAVVWAIWEILLLSQTLPMTLVYSLLFGFLFCQMSMRISDPDLN